jgi:hypothetical protein
MAPPYPVAVPVRLLVLKRMLWQVNPGLVQGRVYRKTMINCSNLMNLIKKFRKARKNISVGEETFNKYL